jgi:hypothetical protein
LFFSLFPMIHHTGEHSPLFTIHHINSLFCFRCGLPPKFFLALSFYEVDIRRSSFSSRTASSVFLRSSFAIFFSCLETLQCNFEWGKELSWFDIANSSLSSLFCKCFDSDAAFVRHWTNN